MERCSVGGGVLAILCGSNEGCVDGSEIVSFFVLVYKFETQNRQTYFHFVPTSVKNHALFDHGWRGFGP